jgi:digeranylgeranylglycerophospholipid reductase
MKLYDALVIGAGPVGSHVAYKLAGLGYKVAVFEQHEEIGQPVCCTGIVSEDCVQQFGIPKDLIWQQANSAKLFAPSGEFLRVWQDQPQACIIDRAGFDLACAQRAKREGAEYFLANRVQDIAVSTNGVMVKVDRQEDGAELEGKTAVIATGFASKLPQRLGLGRVSDFIIGAQTEVSIKGVDEVEVYFGQDTAPGFFAWLVPISQDKALAGLFSRKKPSLYLENLLTLLSRQGKIACAGAKAIYDGIPLRSLPRTYAPRIVVVGDAAGQVKPTTGGGIYYGLLCAEIAAETIHQALSIGDFSQKLFAQYERAWRKRLGRELRIGYLARRFYERLSDRQINEMFRIIQANGIDETLLRSPRLSFDWHGGLILRGLQLLAPWHHLFQTSWLGHVLKKLKNMRPWWDSNPQPSA